MAIIRTNSSTTAGVNLAVAVSDEVYIAQGAFVGSSASDAIQATNQATTVDFIIAGDVFGDDDGIETIADNSTVTVLEGGAVSAGDDAVVLSGIVDGTVVNHGSITGDFFGVNISGTLAAVTNFGSITGVDVEAVRIATTTSTTTNYGTMIASGTQIGDNAIEFNTGGASTHDLFNYGTISAVGGIAINTSANATATVHNEGSIQGDVDLSSSVGISTVTNSGSITGDVNFGSANDIYTGMSSGDVTGRVNGGAGNDTLTGSDANDDIRGGNQGDLIEGGGGNDALLGEQGQDIINGGDGNDRLFGQANGDRLDGGSGLDFLTGGLAADVFFFRQGNDVDIIQDFADGTAEKIDVSDFATADAMAAIAGAYQVGNQVRINFGDGDLLALNGVTVAQIDNSDFIFA